MSSIEIAEFENLKTIGIPRCLGFSKQNRPYNCFLCGLAGKIPTFPKILKVCKIGKNDVKKSRKRNVFGTKMALLVGLAFLRKSHAGCDSPPDCRQEPAFESNKELAFVSEKELGENRGFSLN